MKLNSLHDLVLDQLRDLYSMEKQIVKALPKVIRKCTNEQLREALSEHLEETKGQVERLEEAFEACDTTARARKCLGMEGILLEGEEFMGEDAAPAVMDAGIIAACQKVEHYEIASYGSIGTWCDELGLTEVGERLKANLAEEKAADEKLTEVAESMVNKGAESAEEEAIPAARGNGRRHR